MANWWHKRVTFACGLGKELTALRDIIEFYVKSITYRLIQ